MKKCALCKKEFPEESLFKLHEYSYLSRSSAMYIYDRKLYCSQCLKKQKKKDNKIQAIILVFIIVIILFIMATQFRIYSNTSNLP